MNLPGAIIDLPTLTDKDEDDIVDFGLKKGIDLIAASFVRKASDIDYIRDVLMLRSSLKLKTKKVFRTTMRSFKLLTVSWLPEVIWEWKSHPRRSSLLKSG